MRVQIQAHNIVWTVQRVPSGRLVAWCDALGLTTEGDGEGDLHSAIAECHDVLFRDLLEDGELDAFLTEHGWTKSRPLTEIPEEGVAFEVPYSTSQAPAHAAS